MPGRAVLVEGDADEQRADGADEDEIGLTAGHDATLEKRPRLDQGGYDIRHTSVTRL